jgi:hypothetical protein
MQTDDAIIVPKSVQNTEDLTLWLSQQGRGKAVDLQGRTLWPKGGYEKVVYGLEWHEHPHAHWYLPFLPSNTKICNGHVIVSDRIALICEGPGIVLENMTLEGAASRYSAVDTMLSMLPLVALLPVVTSNKAKHPWCFHCRVHSVSWGPKHARIVQKHHTYITLTDALASVVCR